MRVIFKSKYKLFVVGFSILFSITFVAYLRFLDTPLQAPLEGMVWSVPKGCSLYKLASDLKTRGLIRHKWFFIALAHTKNVATRLQVGEYFIDNHTLPRTLLERMAKGRVVQYALTVIEGWTFQELMQAIAKEPKLVHTLAGLDSTDIMIRLGYPGEHPEGRFFPDTYYFPAGTTDVDFLKRAYRELSKRLEQVWGNKYPNLPYKAPYEALILASIIQKESPLPNEYQEIAGVYLRRLQKKMRLQADPTVIYGLGTEYNKRLTYAQLRLPTPYNTYLKGGLPITPIALVGMQALQAAVSPSTGETLYFVATGAGNHIFSKTLAEHNQAVSRYQRKKKDTNGQTR